MWKECSHLRFEILDLRFIICLVYVFGAVFSA
jgi:hypothetical protein